MLRAFGRKHGWSLTRKLLDVGTPEPLEIDGWSESAHVLCECYAHQGPVKGGQEDKPMSDAIKLLFAEQRLGGQWTVFLLFADDEAAKKFRRGTWRGEALKAQGVHVEVANLTAEERRRLRRIQRRQRTMPTSA